MKKNIAATSISINLWFSSFTLATIITHKLIMMMAAQIMLNIGLFRNIKTIKAIISNKSVTNPKALTMFHRSFGFILSSLFSVSLVQ